MPEIPIRLPIKGLSDNYAFGEQEPGTTRDARNVRSQDHSTGRIRIGQRPGMSQYNTNALNGANKVADLSQVVYDNRNLSYSAVGGSSANLIASKANEAGTDTTVSATDSQGNLYVIEGSATVAKYTNDLERVASFGLPTADPSDVVRSLFVDDVFCIYAAVTEGKQGTARMWKYSQLPENEFEQDWQIDINAFIPKMKVIGDKLYTIQNVEDAREGYLRVYEALAANEPQLTQDVALVWPLTGFDVKKDGSVVFSVNAAGIDVEGSTGSGSGTAQPFSFARLGNPSFPGATQSLIDWTPEDLDNAEGRIWSWYRAEDITEFDVKDELDEQPNIRIWRDRSGNNRHFYTGLEAILGDDGPRYIRRGRLRFPSVRFFGAGGENMTTRHNLTVNPAFRDQQRTMVPGYTNGMFVMFIVVRPVNTTDGVTTTGLYDLNIADVGTNLHLVFNQNEAGSAHDEFGITFYTNHDAGDPPNGSSTRPLSDTDAFNNDNQMCLITLIHDGGVNTGVHDSTTSTRSLNRINGVPLDRWEDNSLVTEVGDGNDQARSRLGGSVPAGPSSDDFQGDVMEIIVLDRKNPDVTSGFSATELIEHERFGPDPGASDASDAQQSDNEMTRIEGYLMHKYGIPTLAPAEESSTFGHPYGVRGSGSFSLTGPPPDGADGPYALFNLGFALVGKVDTAGKLQWTIDGTTVADQDGDVTTGHIGGLGLDVAVNSEGDIYSIGPEFSSATPAESVKLCKLIDSGDSVSAASGDGAFGIDLTLPVGFSYPRISVDKFDNVYVPTSTGVEGYDKDGTQILDYTISGPLDALTVSVDPVVPDYDGDLTTETAENLFVTSVNDGDDTEETIYKLQLVETTSSTGSTRTMQLVGVSGGSIFKVNTSGTPTAPTGGSSALDSASQYVQSVRHFGKVYFTDGKGSIQVYDPREDAVTSLVAKASGGTAPQKVRLIESWRGRLVVARGVGLIDEAFNWKMSAIDDPENWDLFPPRRTAAQAIAGTNSIGPGKVPDIVNGFVPYNDDIAYVLCDHSIWMLNGDPMDGGQFDLVSDITGGSFGRAWAKDPEGNLYFFGSRGGLFIMRPGQVPQRVSLNRIERRLQNIDLENNYVRLEWNYRDEGLHIIQCPFGSGGSRLLHYFYDAKVGAFWEDTFGTAGDTSVQPTSIFIVDGDDVDDRTILFGCEDGRVRKWDESAKSDDTLGIDAYVTCGPLSEDPSPIVEARFVGPQVILANDLDGARYEMFAVTEPDDLGTVHRSGDLQPGVNTKRRDRVRGLYAYLRLRNSLANQKFAVESITMDAYPGGRKRQRSNV